MRGELRAAGRNIGGLAEVVWEMGKSAWQRKFCLPAFTYGVFIKPPGILADSPSYKYLGYRIGLYANCTWMF